MMPIQERARRYIATMPQSIEGSGGHTAIFNVALAVRCGFDLSEDATLELLSEWNATHAQPPWNAADLRHKIQDAGRSTKPAGYLLANDQPAKPAPTCPDEAAATRAKWPEFRSPGLRDLRALANLRHLDVRSLIPASHEGLLQFTQHPKHGECYVFTEGTFAQIRRVDGQPLRLSDGSAQKDINLPGSKGSWFGYCLLEKHPAAPVLLIEGCIGLLEAMHTIRLAKQEGWIPFAANSASSKMTERELTLLKGRQVIIAADRGKAGADAAIRWQASLAGCDVTAAIWVPPPEASDLGKALCISGFDPSEVFRSDQPEDPEISEARLRLTEKQVCQEKETAPAKTKKPGKDGDREEPPAQIDAFYDSDRKQYLVLNNGGRWLAHNESGFKRIVRASGFRPKVQDDEMIGPVEAEMLRIVNHCDVQFCGPLAGREAGFFCENGIRGLVTDSPNLVRPQQGDFPTIRAIIHGLFVASEETHGPAQELTFQGWLASAVRSLYEKKPRPGQAIAFAGPPGCGKSVLQNEIITPLLGGRSAKAALFMQGRTDFNSDLFGAEHLMLEDEHSDTDIKSRNALGANLKRVSVNQFQPCHGKGRQIVNLRPWWRLSISLNDEPERLLVIPPLADDISDKLILLRASRFIWPMPSRTGDEWAEMMRIVAQEMPAYLHFLLHHLPSPAHHCDRFGVKAWHHPTLVESLTELAPENHLAEMIGHWLLDTDLTSWRGTAAALRAELLENHKTKTDARDLLKWFNACGNYLGKIAAKKNLLGIVVENHRTNTARTWEIRLASVGSQNTETESDTVSPNF